MPGSGVVRLRRGMAAGSLATVVALVSHVSGGGAAPGWMGLLVPWVASVWVCVMLAARRLSLPRVGTSVAASQVLFHYLFVLGTAAPASGPAGHHHHGGGPEILAAMSGPAAHAAHGGASMWLWHGVAAVFTTAALYGGERAFLQVRDLVGMVAAWVRRRFALLAVLPVRPRLWAPAAATDRVFVPLGLPAVVVRRRGPPALVLAA